ncbi:MAG: tetratricopeptide repeat protein [Chloroflexi bacterium]|nr:tetratricopeptide repeat protein [Chloroflexota bacterium]
MIDLHAYLPQDRRRALARGEILPDQTTGAALLADIAGFTPLTEALTQALGPRRGSEELTRQINTVYDALITAIERYGGSVISFAGDAIICWFDGDTGPRAATAALALQAAMAAFPTLGLKVAVTSGPARRLVVGDPSIQLLDTLAGATIARLTTAEHLATSAETVVAATTAVACGAGAVIRTWRTAADGERFAVLQTLAPAVLPESAAPSPTLDAAVLRPWILPAVWAREQSGLGVFLTELRPAVALFLRFAGPDYDADEQAGAQLDTFICQVQAILTRYGGALLQLTIGDKGSYLCAACGAPTAHEDDARRAVQAAVELKDLVPMLPFGAAVQIGISRGLMRTGAYGGATRRVYGVFGDEVNLAARLMTAAAAGQILVSGRVHQEVSEWFRCEPGAPLHLKGKAAPVPVFTVTGRRHRRAIRLEEPRYALPLVGRQTELALIAARLELARQGHGQVIGITAAAGLGKSRLVAEVIRLAQQRGFTTYGGACESSGLNTPYLVWKPIWQAFFDVDPAAPLAYQMRQLASQVQDLAPARVPALPVLAPLLDLPLADNDFTRALTPQDRRNVLTAILEDCLKAVAATRPLLLVLEDLHWLDALSHDLLETLARVSATLLVGLVLAYRPPETARLAAPRLESLPHFTRVTLDQLTAAEAEQLIQAKLAQLFPPPPHASLPALAAALAARTEGHPFYIEELLNYLRDQGVDPYTAALETLEWPTSLHALILSRMDHLSEAQKATLKTASIIGRVFRVAWLQGYYPSLGPLEQLKANLAELAHLDLTPLDTPEPELAYLFKHLVTREVAYESLTYAARAQLHEQLARFIETLDADHYLDLLAFHYSQSDNAAKQREYLQKAANAAQATFANEAALDYLGRLLPLLADPGAQLDLHLQRGAIRELLGQWPEAEADYGAALDLGERSGDAAAVARCQRALGILCRLRGDYPAALAWLAPARDTQAALGDQAGLARTVIETGSVWWRLGEYDSARQELEAGLALARALADQSAAAQALNDLGNVAYHQGDPAARAWFEASLALRRELGDQRGIAHALGNLGMVVDEQGDYAAARAWFEESLALFHQVGDQRGISLTLNNLGIVAHEQGDYAAARALYEESLTLHQEMGDRPGVAMSLINLGNLALEQDEVLAAQTAYRASLKLLQELSDQTGLVFSLSGLAAVAAQMAHAVRAAQLAAAAETLRASVGVPWEATEGQIYERAVTAARAGLGPADFAAAWVVGEQMTLDEAIASALAV